MALSNQAKILIVVLIVSATYIYSKITKDFFDQYTKTQAPILTTLPRFGFMELNSAKEEFSHYIFKDPYKGIFVHFWGTWCSPCEAEFPELIKFAKLTENDSVKFLLIAINDKSKDLEKFLKKFQPLPSNIVIGLDDGKSMDLFGTSKVPETYLFDNQKNFVTKFIGPQNWEAPQFIDQTKNYLKL